MKELILSSKKILIVLPEKLNIDLAAASLGLAHILKSMDKEVSLSLKSQFVKDLKHVLIFDNFHIINSIKQSEVILSLNRKKGAVKAVRWREIEDKIQFIITPESDDFEFNDVDLSSTGSDFDLAIFIGCTHIDDAGSIVSSNTDFFDKVNIINIDIHTSNTNYGKINKIGSNNSLSGWIFDLAETEEFDLNEKAVESLFKGIFWANEGFRQNSNLKKALQKLISTNGEFSSVIYQMFDTLTIAELRYLGKIISNMNIDSEGTIISKVTNNDSQGVKPDRIIYPEINIISRVKDYKIAIILTEYEVGKVSVRIYSKDKTINIFQKYIDFTPIGNSRRITFLLDGQLDEIAQKLLDQIKSPVNDNDKTDEVTKKEEDAKDDNTQKGTPKKDDGPLPLASSLPQAIDSSPNFQMPQMNPSTPIQQQAFNPTPPIYPSQPLPPAQQPY